MNSCTFIVKIISTPQHFTSKQNIKGLKVKVQFAQPKKRKKSFDQFEIVIWKEKKVAEFLNYYRIGDYILVGGSLNFEQAKSGSKLQKNSKLGLKISCPFWLPLSEGEESKELVD